MRNRVQQELEITRKGFEGVEAGPGFDWILIRDWALPDGWSVNRTSVLVLVPPGYPTVPPDNFYTGNDLRLSGGGLPQNVSPNQSVAGDLRLLFSYHLERGDWRPAIEPSDGHNLLTFLNGVGSRLGEAS